jgi:demethylmenaquinone methyltransferase/2-methoxy-6-polyprenyl-1,4-benzoquinol methylase
MAAATEHENNMSKTHFGFESVDEREKARRVRGVFDSVAPSYDLMNDLMSMGLHPRLEGVRGAGAPTSSRASGCWTSPAAPATWRRPSPARSARPAWWCTPTSTRPCCASDATACSMPASVLPTLVCDAEKLALRGEQLRPRQCRLRAAQHDPQGQGAGRDEPGPAPGGKLLVLEFSKVARPLEKAYDWYSFNVLPRLGRFIARDEASYRYLAESIRMHPGQEELKGMMKMAGFGHVDYHNLTAGVAALHVGIKC